MKSICSLRTIFSVFALSMSLALGMQSASSRPAGSQQSSPFADAHGEDIELRSGPFAIAGQNYEVVMHEKRLANVSDPVPVTTLAALEIRDAAGNVVYQKAFPLAIEQGRFARAITASAQLASGKTGAGLVLLYRELGTPGKTNAFQSGEFWQLFGLVNGKLAPLGKPSPIGERAANGPYMGVIMSAANGRMSVISQPDEIEIRAWTGNFYVFVPLRVDWNHGGLAAGQRCMEMVGGGMQETGCDMRVDALRNPPADEFTFVRLFTEARENMGNAEHVVIQKDSKIDILGARAITTWNETGDLIQPVFSDIWLHVRIGNREGWIHGAEDLAAAGLPVGSAAP
jgi:hypothetical protein